MSIVDTDKNSRTLREKVADRLRHAIISGNIKPGARLQEIEIAEKFETSRTPVREAFRQLESEGFLTIKPRRGAIVSQITTKDIKEFYEMKSVLEGYAARCAAERITPEQIEKMERLNLEMLKHYEAGDIAAIVPVHNRFHEVFIRACGNDQLASLIENLVSRFQRYRIALSHTRAVEDSIRRHQQIVEAFRSRDANLVAELVMQNSMDGSDALVNTFKRAA